MALLKVPYLHLDPIDVRLAIHIRDHGPIDHECLHRRFPGLSDVGPRLERLIGAGLVERGADHGLRMYRARERADPGPPPTRPWAPTMPFQARPE